MRMLVTVAICLVVFIAVFVMTLRLMENSFIYFPSRDTNSIWDAASHGLTIEDVWLIAEDGVRIHGWYVKAQAPQAGDAKAAGSGEENPVILLFHGNGGNITDRTEKLALLASQGADVFIIDYRGYGKSGGHPSEAGIYTDGAAAYQHLTSVRGVEPRRIILFGESLGGAVACEVAGSHKVGGIILESSFTSAIDVARKVFPLLPPQIFLKSRFDNLGKIAHITAPVLILHGTQDTTIPPAHARRLYAAANGPKTLTLIPGAGHNDVFLVGGKEYTGAISRFLAECISKQERVNAKD